MSVLKKDRHSTLPSAVPTPQQLCLAQQGAQTSHICWQSLGHLPLRKMQVSQVAELLRTAAFRVKVGRALALHLQGWQCGAMAEAIPLVAGAVSAKGLQGERAPAEITVLVTNLHHPGGTTSPREVQNGNHSVLLCTT